MLNAWREWIYLNFWLFTSVTLTWSRCQQLTERWPAGALLQTHHWEHSDVLHPCLVSGCSAANKKQKSSPENHNVEKITGCLQSQEHHQGLFPPHSSSVWTGRRYRSIKNRIRIEESKSFFSKAVMHLNKQIYCSSHFGCAFADLTFCGCAFLLISCTCMQVYFI